MTNFAEMGALAAPMMPHDDVSLAMRDLSDRGNAERFVARHGRSFLYVRALGWLHFVGTHWSADGAEDAALLAAAQTAAAILEEAKALFEAAERDPARADMLKPRAVAVKDWATTSGGVNRLKAMLTIAAPTLSAELEDFDADPLALNCENGTVRFLEQDGRWIARLDPHDPADRISRLVPFAYDPAARAREWERHLKKTVPDIYERLFLQRLLGYCALGVTREQVFFMWQGRGGDGKSVTSGVVRRVLGSYACACDVKTFLEDKTGRSAAAASPDLARLAGATRFVSMSEPPRGARLNEGLVKQFTGGAPITARHLNKDPFEFTPRGRLVMEVNARPAIGGSDDGIWRRVVVMPWRVQLKRAEMDPDIENRIVGEGAGVLAWIVEGALKYLERGIDPPAEIAAAHADYKRGSNSFREWLETATERLDGHVELLSSLYASYRDHMEGLGQEPMHQKTFGLALSDHQIPMTKREGETGRAQRIGLRLLTAAERATAQAAADADLAAGPGALSICLTGEASASRNSESDGGNGQVSPDDWPGDDD